MSPIESAHRLLAPRVAYLIGTRALDGAVNLIPVSNLTSISTEPQQIALAAYKQWDTYRNLTNAAGFTISLPHIDQLDGVWRLGAKYSHYPYLSNAEKIADSGLLVDQSACAYGPVLSDGMGWAACRLVERLDFGGDHGVFIGRIEDVHFNPKYFGPEGVPRADLRPVMQITGNIFTTAADPRTIPYYQPT